MFNLLLKLQFVANLNKTPYPFMGYMEININRFYLIVLLGSLQRVCPFYCLM